MYPTYSRAASCATATSPERGAAFLLHAQSLIFPASTTSSSAVAVVVASRPPRSATVCGMTARMAPTRATALAHAALQHQQTPPNGYIQGASMTSYSSQIAFGCYQPYVLQGPATRTCQLSGKWDGVPPVCTLASPYKSGFQPCHDGTCLASSKFCNGVFFECPDNTDEYQCGTTGPGVCTPLAKPTNVYSQGTNYSAGGSVVFGCNSGYNLQGGIVRICQIDGSWSGAAASCNPIQLQCQSGYLPCLRSSGCILPSQRCDGVWYDCADGSEQYCPGKATPAPGQTDCQVLSQPALGSMTVNGLMFSNTTTFVCTSPYVPMDSAVRTCEINGQWSGVQPTCVLTTAALSAASDELVKDSISERMTQTC
ncbi:CUB and sushi domain-containing protein 3-like isoform X3 [Sycon ciliatum]|uniref:CUB and sushi domain-containing protein 3-like isoform X3 n=1 Tax=Sycon ciliatum TaxID=27933 RepID=UPI0031F63AC2